MPRFAALCVPIVAMCVVAILASRIASAQGQRRLYAAVADEKGEPVLGLTEDDFELSLDGTPLTVASAELDDAPPRIALLVDTGGKDPGAQCRGPAARGAREFSAHAGSPPRSQPCHTRPQPPAA